MQSLKDRQKIKNFKQPFPIPAEDIIDLAHLNNSLSEVNNRFVGELSLPQPPGKRFTIAEAQLPDG